LQRLRVKEPCGLGEGTQGGTWTAEFVLDLVEATGLLHGAETGKDGIEEGQEEKGGIVIIEEPSIAGVIACSADVVERLEEGFKAFEVLEPLDVVGGDLGFAWWRHEGTLFRRLSKWRENPPAEDTAAFMPNDEKWETNE